MPDDLDPGPNKIHTAIMFVMLMPRDRDLWLAVWVYGWDFLGALRMSQLGSHLGNRSMKQAPQAQWRREFFADSSIIQAEEEEEFCRRYWDMVASGLDVITDGWLMEHPGFVDEQMGAPRAIAAAYTLASVVSRATLAGLALMHCRNVVSELAPYPQRLARARIRRGRYPPIRYHTLRVKPVTKVVERQQKGPGWPVAIHWIRGHFKRYTEERKLFGRLTGTYWWQPHVAGKAKRVVLKDYALAGLER